VKELEEAAWPNHHLSRYVRAAGLRWHVQVAGDGPDMLLVHGTAASTHSWRDLMPIFSQRHRVLAVDLPGHGFTDGGCCASLNSHRSSWSVTRRAP
jgi:magnesium chelatase accessory protein